MATSVYDEEQIRTILKFILHLNDVNHNLRRLVGDMAHDISLITAVFRYYEAYHEIQIMLNSGPSTNLVDYIVELDRLNDAHQYFKQIHAEDELKRSVVLYNIGIQKLIEESDRSIVHCSTAINPDELIEICKSTTYEPVSTEGVQGLVNLNLSFLVGLLFHFSIRSECVSNYLRLV